MTPQGHPPRRRHERRQRRRARGADRAVPDRDGGRLHGQPLHAVRLHGVPRRVGPGRSQVRHLDHVVPARRRPLHGLHLRRGACGDVHDRRGGGLLRGALHDRALPDHLHLHGAAVVGEPPPRLRHDRRLRPGQVRRPRAVARRRGHRLRGHDALHRAAARRHPGGARGGRPRRRRQHHRQGRAPLHRLRAARGLHLLQRPAGASGHRVRQGHPDLPRHHRGDRLPARPGAAAGTRSSARRRTRWRPPTRSPASRPGPSSRAPASTGPTPPSRSGRRWRCSCTRTP